jgi:type II secretory pathway predicted ATPase ExeA
MIEPSASAPLVHPFGLHTAPFADSAEDAFFFPSDQHLRALEFMGHSLWTRARLGVVTAEHGCGKSYLIRPAPAARARRPHRGGRGAA